MGSSAFFHSGCFNPRARGGTTRASRRSSPARARFNPRAREGRDYLMRKAEAGKLGFQSTRPRGARRQFLTRPFLGVLVSIHAPVRGATRRGRTRPASPTRFNPRAREGRDLTRSWYLHAPPTFQSTRPRGARPAPRFILFHFLPVDQTGDDTIPLTCGRSRPSSPDGGPPSPASAASRRRA